MATHVDFIQPTSSQPYQDPEMIRQIQVYPWFGSLARMTLGHHPPTWQNGNHDGLLKMTIMMDHCNGIFLGGHRMVLCI